MHARLENGCIRSISSGTEEALTLDVNMLHCDDTDFYQISDMDFLSTLPDDIIPLILVELSFEELDVVCQVSRKLLHFAKYAKQIKKKEDEMEGLRIRQKHNGDFIINMRHADREYNFLHKNFYMIVNRDKFGTVNTRKGRYFYHREPEELIEDHQDDFVVDWDNFDLTDVVDGEWRCPLAIEIDWSTKSRRSSVLTPIYKGIEYLLTRFSCSKISFEAVLVDDDFMLALTPILKKANNLMLSFDHAFPKRMGDKGDTKRFLTWLTSLKAKSLTLNRTFFRMTGDIYDRFLKTFAEATPTTDLTIFNDVECRRFFPKDILIESISKLIRIDLRDLMLDANIVLEILKQRFRIEKAGKLYLNTSKTLNSLLINALRDEFEVGSIAADGTEMRLKKSKLLASIRFYRKLEVDFTENS